MCGSGTNAAQMTQCEAKLLHTKTVGSEVAQILILILSKIFLLCRDTTVIQINEVTESSGFILRFQDDEAGSFTCSCSNKYLTPGRLHSQET